MKPRASSLKKMQTSSKPERKLKKEKIKITNILEETGAITIDPADIKRMRECYKPLYTHEFYKFYEVDQSLEKQKLSL